MKKLLTGIVTLGLVAILVPYTLAKPNTPNNGNSHNKATGGVTWTARGGALPGIVTTFNAHDVYEGGQDDKGIVETYRPSDAGFVEGSIIIDLACVNVQEGEAWFAGTAVSGTGGYSAKVGNVYLYWVDDNATPGAEEDRIGGMPYSNIDAACADVETENWTGSGLVDEGNLVVHYSTPEPVLCDVYTIEVDSVNGNSNYWHDYETSFCPDEDPVGEWLGGASGLEYVYDIGLTGDVLAFTAEYDSNGYTWYPKFTLVNGGTLSFIDGHGADNVNAATGTWSMTQE